MWYVLSFAFQLSGGVILLLLWVFTDARKKVVDVYHPVEALAQPDDNDMCTLKKERIQEIATDIYRNRFAFGDLCAGYLIAIIAEKTLSDCAIFLCVVILTIVITWIEYYFAKVLAKRNFPDDMQVPVSILRKLGVSTSASDREFNEMLGELYGENNVQ